MIQLDVSGQKRAWTPVDVRYCPKSDRNSDMPNSLGDGSGPPGRASLPCPRTSVATAIATCRAVAMCQ